MKALLLDLDNTLLDIQFEPFMKEYMHRIGQYFAGSAPTEQLQHQLVASTRVMIENDDPQRTILDAFVDDFFGALGLPADMMDKFTDFYATEFPKLSHWGKPAPYGRTLIEAALEKGLIVAIATAPMFPIEAIRERLRWAELDDLDFDLITSADTMSFSKPSPRYYEEIAERLEVEPEACVMIGDEKFMDGPAAQIGMRVMLVGPERPSNMTTWFGDMFDGVESPEFDRYPSMEAVMGQLRSEGIL